MMVNGVARCLTQLVITDLDGTLYWGDGRHALLLRSRTMEWIGRAKGLGDAAVTQLYHELAERYPNPLVGLGSIGLSVEEYHAHVFDSMPVDLVPISPAVVTALQDCPVPVVVVTLASRGYADRVLDVLGLTSHIATVETPGGSGGWLEKSDCYRNLLRRNSVPPEACVVLGDRWLVDVAPALAMGCWGVLIGREHAPGSHLRLAVVGGIDDIRFIRNLAH
jgi:FMN phosphatase YigB (HAD superfamily)